MTKVRYKLDDGDNDSISERSYDVKAFQEDMTNKFLQFTYSLPWKLISMCVNFMLYFLETYDIHFEHQIIKNPIVYMVTFLSNMFVMVDIIAAVMRENLTDTNKFVYISLSKPLYIIDIVSIYTVLVEIIYLENEYLKILKVILISLRNYRILVYHYWFSKSGRIKSIFVFCSKYIFIYAFIIHTFNCLWVVSCQGCTPSSYRNNTFYTNPMTQRLSVGIEDRYKIGLRSSKFMTPLELYVATLFFVIGSITNVGFGNPGSGNDVEMGLSMATMFISMFINILFISDLSAMKIGEYLSQVEFSNSLRQIRKYLHHERIPKKTCNKIMKYYINFWHQKSTLTTKVYYDILPKALQKEVMLDVFWFALHRMYLFKNESVEFKRLVASVMEVEYYNKGDLVLEHGQMRLKSFFIARGSVCILSQEDSESPVLTLGVGSCFGEMHIFYTIVGKFSIVAQTYCILHTLTNPRFWCLMNMQCYHRSRNIIQTMNVKMQYARSKKIGMNTETVDKSLIQMKEVLNDETQLNIYDARNIYKLGNFTEFHDSYILSKMQISSYDGIFSHTEWPWKFREDCNFIHIWEYIVIFTTILLLFYWPLKVLFKIELSGYMIAICKIYFTLIFGLDVIIQLFTVIETPQKSYITFTEIFEARCTNLGFVCDFISALPLDTMATLLLAEDTKSNIKYRIIIFSLRFLKLYRLPLFIKKLELRFMSIKFHIFKCIKHFFFIICFSYLNGCIYYMILYFNWKKGRIKDGWFKKLYENLQKDMYSFEFIKFIFSMFHSVALVTQVSVSHISNMQELLMTLLISSFSLFLFNYSLGDYSAALSLTRAVWYKYVMRVRNMKKFMAVHKITAQSEKRIISYMESQWLYDGGLRNKELLRDLPDFLYNEQQIAYYLNLIQSVPLFQNVPLNVQESLASLAQTEFLPPGEIVVYNGVALQNMYIIDQGYCEILSDFTLKVKRTLKPNDHFCCIACLLQKPYPLDIRTITHVSLVKITRADVLYAFKLNPPMFEDFKILIEELRNDMEKDDKVKKRKTDFFRGTGVTYESHKSWFVFPNKRNHKLNIEFRKKFEKNSVFWLLKFVAMKKTLMPDGKFCFYYEIMRTIFVWFICMINPAIYIYEKYIPNMKKYMLYANALLIVDIYMQMHVCYYNQNGLLISHPSYTAQNYIKTRMPLDIFAMIPLDMIITIVFDKTNRKIAVSICLYEAVATMNKFLLIFRSRCLIHSKKILEKPVLTLVIIYFIAIFLIFYNYLACMLMLTTGKFVFEPETQKYYLRPKNFSWLTDDRIMSQVDYDLNEPIFFYLTCLRWVSMYVLLLGYERNDLAPDGNEKILSIFCCLIGYMTMMAFIVRIAANMGITNKLSSFYSNLSHLKRFLNEEKVTKELTKTTIDYFEFKWARTKGTNCKLFRNVSDSIKQDLAVILYSQTLLKAPPFLQMGIGLIRRLGLNFKELYVLDNVYVILRNDILDKLYIVHKGIVAVYTADGSFLELLGKGSMFGNIDEVNMSRSMVSVQARTNVELLEINTIQFYKLLENDPECIARMNYHIIVKSLSHITSSTNCKIFKPPKRRINVFFQMLIWMQSSMAMELAFAMLSFITVTFYMMFEANLYVKVVITILDVICIIKIFVNLRHKNIMYKQLQRSRRKRITRFPVESFLLDLLSILPIEALAYFFTGDIRSQLFTFLHINRLLRMVYIFRYLKEVEQTSNHFVLEKVIAITSYILLVIHGGTCIFFSTAKLSEIYLHRKSWLSSKNCNDTYVCSLFYTITTITFHGHPFIVPHSPTDIIVCIVFSTGCKYIFATITGFILSFYAHIKLSLNLYNQVVEKLLTTLRRSNISKKLIQNVRKYTHQIWIQNNGHQMPKFLTLAPSCVTNYVMMEIFGKHLTMNPIFCNCHVDFLRQLSSKLQLTNYFASDVICHAGEVNSTMYFIQSGQVEVLDIEASDEFVIDILGKDDCFGIVQGLINCAKHVHTFRASHICKILSLEYKDWEFLLPFFPASKFTIYESLENITNRLQPN